MIKDFIAITILAWMIKLTAKAIIGAFRLVGRALKGIGAMVGGLVDQATAQEGVVTSAIDGDSIIVKTDEGDKEVRIKGIDAPEYGQDGFLAAKLKVRSLTLGQKVTLLNAEIDKYGRTASDVEINHNATSVAEELANAGVAYPDPRGTTKKIKNLSKRAKSKSLGVWKTPGKTPWEFRETM